MSIKKPLLSALLLTTLFGASACTEPEDTTPDTAQSGEVEVSRDEQVKGGIDGKADASVVATFVDLSFSGSLITDYSYRPEAQIEDQLLYTIGHLNGDDSVGRLDKLKLSNIKSTRQADGKTLISYDASLLVAWGKKNNVPKTYTLTLPRNVSSSALNSFAEKYGHDCVDYGAHDITSGSMWYYYRPNSYRCKFSEEDVIRVPATLTVSAVNTTGKYPEYHKVWEDDVLKVVAIFGKYEDGATSNSDAGIDAYNDFLAAVKGELKGNGLESEPANVPSNPGVTLDDVTFRATLPGDRKVEIVALLVDNVRTAGPTFTSRYNALSADADFIAYNGHAGLGANIRALASKGKWEQGQYSIVFMNGCDTYAYIDNALFEARAAVNPEDPEGSLHLDIITNAKPSFFSNMSASTMTFVRGLSNPEEPMTFEEMFRNISTSQVILVSGEHDNVFVPGYMGDMPPVAEPWSGLQEKGSVSKDEEVFFATPNLEPGSYTFTMEGTNDADLYVRIGDAPSVERYDCRPYRAGSNETCTVELNSPAPVVVMVRGWDPSSEFSLVGKRD